MVTRCHCLSTALILTLVFLGASTHATAEQTISCSGNQIDVLDWMTLDLDLRSSKHMTGSHSMYTVVNPDKFYWIKTPEGDTWDIQLYDQNWIYLWITERVWQDPNDYKRHAFNFNMTMMPRCATPGFPGTAFRVTDTSYKIATDCVEGSLLNLQDAIFELWGPYNAGQPGLESSRPPIGGDIPDSDPIYVVGYRWGCVASSCSAREEFMLHQRYGLVRHTRWDWDGSGWSLKNRTTFNTLVTGTVTPHFPCF